MEPVYAKNEFNTEYGRELEKKGHSYLLKIPYQALNKYSRY
jgi:hypothetical protein